MSYHASQLAKYSPIQYSGFEVKGRVVVLPKKCPNCKARGLRTKTEGVNTPRTFSWCYECGWKSR